MLDSEGARAPIWKINDKASGYRFAMSHGIRVPHVYGEYARASDIDWDALPEEFVLKMIAGTASKGVFPLTRDGDGFRDLIDRSSSTVSAEATVAMLEKLHSDGVVSSELIVEELMRAPQGHGLEVIPDYKLFCFYGVVGMIQVVGRRFRGAGGQEYRLFSADGADLGDAELNVTLSSSLPPPSHLEDLIAAGEKLSSAIKRPMVRVDMHELDDGVVFGEITPAPGGDHIFRDDVDALLGELWEQAEVRLEKEVIAAGSRESVFGPHPHESLVATEPSARRAERASDRARAASPLR